MFVGWEHGLRVMMFSFFILLVGVSYIAKLCLLLRKVIRQQIQLYLLQSALQVLLYI